VNGQAHLDRALHHLRDASAALHTAAQKLPMLEGLEANDLLRAIAVFETRLESLVRGAFDDQP
jgi:hypothetical protein